MVVMSREVRPFSCGTALSGGGPALLTAGCWNGFTAKSLWLPSLYSKSGDCQTGEHWCRIQWLLLYKLFDFWLFLFPLHLLFPHQSRMQSWLFVLVLGFFSMTGLTNCSPAENACLSVNTLTRVFINISMRKWKWWPKCWVTGLQ